MFTFYIFLLLYTNLYLDNQSKNRNTIALFMQYTQCAESIASHKQSRPSAARTNRSSTDQKALRQSDNTATREPFGNKTEKTRKPCTDRANKPRCALRHVAQHRAHRTSNSALRLLISSTRPSLSTTLTTVISKALYLILTWSIAFFSDIIDSEIIPRPKVRPLIFS